MNIFFDVRFNIFFLLRDIIKTSPTYGDLSGKCKKCMGQYVGKTTACKLFLQINLKGQHLSKISRNTDAY